MKENEYTVKAMCGDCKEWRVVTLSRDLAHDEISPAVQAQSCNCKEQAQSVLA